MQVRSVELPVFPTLATGCPASTCSPSLTQIETVVA